jgi:hypothetical protein
MGSLYCGAADSKRTLKRKPPPKQGPLNPYKSAWSAELFLLACLRVFAAETLNAAGRVHQLLLAGEKRVAAGADFYVDVAFMRRTSHKRVAACALHAYLVVVRMDSCLHIGIFLCANL